MSGLTTDGFDKGELTALICVDEPEYQHAITRQLGELGYNIHEGLFAEDVLLKLKSYAYDVIVVYENFNGAIVENNTVLFEAVSQPMSRRRNQYIVLVG